MRVLHIGLSSFPGGVENFVLNYYPYMAEHDVIFDFVDIYGDGLAHSPYFLENGSKIYTLPNMKKSPVRAYRALLKILRENHYEKVHIHMLSAANILPLRAAKKAGLTVIAHSHNNETVGLHRKILHKFNRRRLDKLDFVRLGCSYPAGAWMWGERDFTVIPNAVDTAQWAFRSEWRQEIRKAYQLSDDTLVLGFVGRFSTQKNPGMLIEIMKEIGRDAGIVLLMIGDGHLYGEISEQIKKYHLEDVCIQVGKRDDVEKWYSAMDLLLMPSLFEGLPLTLIEAQAAGLPCFISEWISDEADLTDLVCRLPLEPSAWSSRIKSAEILDDARRHAYCRTLKNTEYSLENAAEKLLEIYRTDHADGEKG